MEAEMKVESDKTIQLTRNEDILRIKIKDENGNYTGESLEFDLSDMDYLLILQQVVEDDKKNREYFRNQLAIIDKKQDHVGKKLYTSNQEAKLKATRDFYKKEEEIYDMFLGEGGVRKLLNGAKPTIARFDAIDEIINEQIYPLIEENVEDLKNKIMKKYSNNTKRDDVIE